MNSSTNNERLINLQIEYRRPAVGEVKNVTILRILGIVGEIAATLFFPELAPATIISIVGASYQTGIDIYAGQGNVLNTVLNYGLSLLPAGIAYARRGKALLRTQNPVLARQSFLEFYESVVPKSVRFDRELELSIARFYSINDYKYAFIQGTRNQLKKLMLASGYSNKPFKSLQGVLESLDLEIDSVREIEKRALRNFYKVSETNEIKIKRLNRNQQKNYSFINEVKRNGITPNKMKNLWGLWLKSSGFENTLSGEIGVELVERYFNNISGRIYKKDIDGFLRSIVSSKKDDKELIFAIQQEVKNAIKINKRFEAITASEIAKGKKLELLTKNKFDEVLKKLDNVKIQQSAVEREILKELQTKQLNVTGDIISGGAGEWTIEELFEEIAKSGGKTIDTASLKKFQYSKSLSQLKQSKKIVPGYKGSRQAIKERGFFQFWGTRQGIWWTQKLQLLSPTDVGREIVGSGYRFIKNKGINLIEKNPFANYLKRLYKYQRYTQKILEKNIIPFYYSAWLFGIRVIKLDPEGLTNKVILFHIDKRYPPIIISKIFTKQDLVEWYTSPSIGAWYIRNIAFSRNGRNLISAVGAELNLLGALIPLAPTRNLLSVTSNIAGVISDIKLGTAPLSSDWLTKTWDTVVRNGRNKSARLVGYFLGGKLGGRVASQSLRQPNTRGFSQLGLSIVQTSVTGRSRSSVARIVRQNRRIGYNAFRRPIGQINKVKKIF